MKWNDWAIVSEKRELRYREWCEAVWGTAQRLREYGIQRGERVAMRLPNCWEYPVLMGALLQVGAIACLIHPRLPAKGVSKLLKTITATKIFSDPSELPIEWGSPPPSESLRPLPLDQPATILFTSGSTGEPKAVLHSYGNHYYSAKGANLQTPVGRGDRWLLSLPLCHVGGLGILFRSLLGKATVVVPSEEPLEESIRKYHITHLSLVPTQLYRLLQTGQDLPSLRYVLLGGAPIPPSLLKEAKKRRIPVSPTYGLTEMASQVYTGKVLKYREMKISEEGEILVRGETLFQGYVKGDRIERPLTPDGWFATGDLGRWDAEGGLLVLGRKDNMFISGGENIHPEEIEKGLCDLSGVEEAVVVPMADREFGARPVAFVKTVDRPLNEERFRSALEKTLPRFKIPIRFYPWPKVGKGESLSRPYFQRLARQQRFNRLADRF